MIRRRSRSGAAVAAVALCALLGGCAEMLEEEARERARATTPKGAKPPDTEASRDSEAGPVERALCPADAQGCRTASGTILYVEAVDPDGDGDAHFVLASDEGISAPGVSIIDVPRDLRPRPLPRVGDRISAAGPVYPGSFGQRQIQAVVLHTSFPAG